MPKRSEIWDHFSIEIPYERAKCEYCQKVISFSGGGNGNLRRHLRGHHADSGIVSNNNNSKKRKASMKRSEVWEHFCEVSKGKAKCGYCQKVLSFSGGGVSNLGRHIRIKHKNTSAEPSFETFTDSEFSDNNRDGDNNVSKKRNTNMKRSEIWEHFSVVSNGRARCVYCRKILSYSGGGTGNLGRHIRTKHEDISLYSHRQPCRSLTDADLSETERDANNKSPETSNSKTPRRSAIWDHFSSVSNGRAKCAYCQKFLSFSGGGPTNLGRHIRIKHKEVSLDFAKKIIPKNETSKVSDLAEYTTDILNNPSQCGTTTSSLISSPKEAQNSSDERKPLSISYSKKLDEQLMKTIVKQYYPFKMVEDPNFKKLVHMLCPNYEVPTKNTLLNTLIPRMFNEVKKKVENMLVGAEAVCLTTDQWTSNAQRSYIGITSHFLKNIETKTELQSCFLGCISYDSNHTSASVGTLLRNEVESWDLGEKVVCVVTDNDSNIVDAVKFNNWRHLPCFSKTLNLVLGEGIEVIGEEINKLKNIVAYFRQSSKAMDLLSSMQEQLSLPPIKLKEDYATKWITTYEMISRAISIKDAIVAVLAIDNPELNCISEREWKVLEEALEIFKIFDIVTKEISGENKLSLSKIMLIINAINTHLIKMSLENTCDEITAVIAILQNAISQRFKEMEANELVMTATILDPRFKRYGFTSQTNFDRYLEIFKRKFQPTTSSVVSENLTQTESETSLIWEDFDTRVQNVINNTNTCPASTNEVDKYLSEPLIKRTEDPLKWWDERKHIYPQLYKMIYHLFCIVGTSVPPERVFSKAWLATDERRSSLKAENTIHCLFLNNNL